jgi:hypothetical protein
MSVIADLFNRMRLSGLAKSHHQVTGTFFNTSSFKGGVRVWWGTYFNTSSFNIYTYVSL